LQLLEPSLRVMIDKVPQARARIATAHRRLLEALEARDEDGAQDWMARHIRDFRKGYELPALTSRCGERRLRRPAHPAPGAARVTQVSNAPSPQPRRALSAYASPRARHLPTECQSCDRPVLLFLIVALAGYLIGVYNGLVRVRAAVKLACRIDPVRVSAMTAGSKVLLMHTCSNSTPSARHLRARQHVDVDQASFTAARTRTRPL